jgi:hypothetical protein
MAILTSRFMVADFDRYWAFHRDQVELQREYGCSSSRVFRSATSPTNIFVLLEFPSAEDAERYLAAALAEGAIRRGGAIGPPRVEIYEEV